MSITAYTGLPGSGKSYGVMKNVIAPALRKSAALKAEGMPGIPVYTNIPTVKEECQKVLGDVCIDIDMADIKKPDFNWESYLEPGCLLVLDELWELWPAGMSTAKARHTDKEILAKHRHLVGENGRSTEIVLVSQDLGQVASFVRQLVETTYQARKLGNIGMDNRYNVNVYQGAVTGHSPPKSKQIRSIKAEKYNPEVFKLYQSHTKSDHGAGNEEKMDKRNNAMAGAFPKVVLGIVCTGAIAVYMTFSGGLLSADTEPEGKATPQVVSAQTPAVMPPVHKIRRVKEPEFLDSLSTIYIEMSNIRNGYHQYTFSATTKDMGQTQLTNKTLKRLGVRVESIDSCLSRLITATKKKLVFCRSNEDTIKPYSYVPTL